MHYLSEEHILLFLTQLFILLTVAKFLGLRFTRWGYPAVAGEILTGILLGPTILGRICPDIYLALFPKELIQQNMLETVSWIGVLFLLLATGFEVNVSSVFKQGKTSLIVGFIGIIVPIVTGCLIFWWFPAKYWGTNANQLTFTLFLSTAAAISAITVIAKILHDIEILKTDFGLLILSAFVVNDFLGWVIFAFVLSLVGQTEVNFRNTIFTFLGIGLFAAICLAMGSKMVSWFCKKIKQKALPHPASVFTLISGVAMLCGMITQWLGIHAILGFLLAGIMAGNSKEISEHTREIMSQMIHAVFVPIFFASIALKIDFLQNLDMFVVVLFTSVAIGGKFIGAWLGAKIAKLSRQDSFSVGIAHIPGGAMEIILGVLALELGLITETVFVAIVFAALLSSIIVGPLLARSIKKRNPIDVSEFLLKDALILDLKGQTREDIFREFSEMLEGIMHIDQNKIISGLNLKEEEMNTSIERGVALPHTCISALRQSVIAFGISRFGVDWDSPDGLPTHFIFLILTPCDQENQQVQILADITNCTITNEFQKKAMVLREQSAIYFLLKEELKKQRKIWHPGKETTVTTS